MRRWTTGHVQSSPLDTFLMSLHHHRALCTLVWRQTTLPRISNDRSQLLRRKSWRGRWWNLAHRTPGIAAVISPKTDKILRSNTGTLTCRLHMHSTSESFLGKQMYFGLWSPAHIIRKWIPWMESEDFSLFTNHPRSLRKDSVTLRSSKTLSDKRSYYQQVPKYGMMNIPFSLSGASASPNTIIKILGAKERPKGTAANWR